MVEIITNVNSAVNNFVWGLPMMVLILGVGAYLSIRCAFPQFAHFGYIMKNTAGKAFEKTEAEKGSVSPFKAMCTALAASIGTGNIAGVSGAIAIGGPGAVFWMWLSALLGMCTKYAEVTLSIKYRERNKDGDWVGGPMYYITNGLGKNWKWLAVLFAIFGTVASFGIGNMVQINTIAATVDSAVVAWMPSFEGSSGETILLWAVSIICAIIVAIVMLGGIERLADVCGLLVPVMAMLYVVAGLIVIIVNIAEVPAALAAIVKGAFAPSAVAGGLAGVGIKTAFTKGVGRGIFSNEAGLGSAPIAHAAAAVDHPVKQGIFGVFEVFMDTIVVCTMTALIVLTGVGIDNIPYGENIGADLTIKGFTSVFPGAPAATAVAVCLTLFALSTVLSWALYGKRCMEYLLGNKAAKVYLVIFCIFACMAGAIDLGLAWDISDTFNGMMAIPNLIGVALLSPVVIKLTREFFADLKAKK